MNKKDPSKNKFFLNEGTWIKQIFPEKEPGTSKLAQQETYFCQGRESLFFPSSRI
jgi:hypothetical protein